MESRVKLAENLPNFWLSLLYSPSPPPQSKLTIRVLVGKKKGLVWGCKEEGKRGFYGV